MTETIHRPIDGNGHVPDDVHVTEPEHKPMTIEGPGAGFYVVCSCGEPPAENELAAAIIGVAFTELIDEHRSQLPREVELAIDKLQMYLIGRLAYICDGETPGQYAARDNDAIVGWLCDDPGRQGPVDNALRHPSGEGPLAASVRALREHRAKVSA